jgi:hypothetical protein
MGSEWILRDSALILKVGASMPHGAVHHNTGAFCYGRAFATKRPRRALLAVATMLRIARKTWTAGTSPAGTIGGERGTRGVSRRALFIRIEGVGMKRATVILLGFFLLGASTAWADPAGQKQAVAFVQKFYDWYLPLANKPLKVPSSEVAIATRPSLFDPALLTALKADAEATRNSSSDVVGLDWDPFLYEQDPDHKFVAGDVAESGGLYRVSIYGVRKGKREANSRVVAELKPAKDSFVFTNFLYGTDGDLLGMLRQMADDRAKPSQSN